MRPFPTPTEAENANALPSGIVTRLSDDSVEYLRLLRHQADPRTEEEQEAEEVQEAIKKWRIKRAAELALKALEVPVQNDVQVKAEVADLKVPEVTGLKEQEVLKAAQSDVQVKTEVQTQAKVADLKELEVTALKEPEVTAQNNDEEEAKPREKSEVAFVADLKKQDVQTQTIAEELEEAEAAARKEIVKAKEESQMQKPVEEVKPVNFWWTDPVVEIDLD